MNNLYQQLMYNWERGFYSVVKNREGYKIVSHRAPLDRLWVTATCDTLDLAKEQLGMSYTIGDNGLIDDFWQIVDTIHPSELMGKGFQVGDKVGFNINRLKGKTGLIVGKNEGTMPASYNILIGDDSEWLLGQYLKPVLPSGSDNQTVKEILTVQKEEKKECVHRFKFFDVKPFIKTIIGETTSGMQRIYCCDNCGLVTCLDPNK